MVREPTFTSIPIPEAEDGQNEFGSGVKRKGISTLKLRRGDNIILAISHYLTVKVLYNVVISPLFFGS